MRTRILWLTFWVTMTMWFGQGCGSMNVSNQPRQATPLPALAADAQPETFTGEPSVDGVDRSGWPAHEVRLTRNDVEIRPNYVRSFTFGDINRVRERGLYPTHATVLDMTDRRVNVQAQYLEIVVDPIVQLGNLVLAPIRIAAITRPREIGHGPIGTYELLPRTDRVDLSPVEQAR